MCVFDVCGSLVTSWCRELEFLNRWFLWGCLPEGPSGVACLRVTLGLSAWVPLILSKVSRKKHPDLRCSVPCNTKESQGSWYWHTQSKMKGVFMADIGKNSGHW